MTAVPTDIINWRRSKVRSIMQMRGTLCRHAGYNTTRLSATSGRKSRYRLGEIGGIYARRTQQRTAERRPAWLSPSIIN
jgi:hypothetical protein